MTATTLLIDLEVLGRLPAETQVEVRRLLSEFLEYVRTHPAELEVLRLRAENEELRARLNKQLGRD